MAESDEPENRQSYRRGSDREIRHLDHEIQRQAEMLLRHERELHKMREDAQATRTLLLGVEGRGGMIDQMREMATAFDHLADSLGDRLDRVRTWAIGAVIAFVTGSIGIIGALIAAHH